MSRVRTRADRLALQRYDDGDDDDIVWYRKGHSKGSRSTAYHEDGECSGIISPENYAEETRRYCQLRWLAPCQLCVLKDISITDAHLQAGGDD